MKKLTEQIANILESARTAKYHKPYEYTNRIINAPVSRPCKECGGTGKSEDGKPFFVNGVDLARGGACPHCNNNGKETKSIKDIVEEWIG